jgi:hypothetical protein
MLSLPAHISAASVCGAPIKFAFTEEALSAVLLKDAPKISGGIYACTNQAYLAFSAALVEWIVWRLEGHGDIRQMLDFVESLWAAVIDPRYAKQFEPPRGDDAFAMICNEAWRSANAQRFKLAEDDADFSLCVELCMLALHVIPATKKALLNMWVKDALGRLSKLYAVPEVDEDNRERCNGAPIPRQVMDTTRPFDPAETPRLLSEFLAGLDPTRNRYLRTPQELRKAGFQGTPYEI